MTQTERLYKLNEYLLDEMPQYRAQASGFGPDEASQLRLFRSLVNVRPPIPASPDFFELQDALLKDAAAKKGIADIAQLLPVQEGIYVWQGDITALRCDAIVNAANSRLLGCFCPCHGCIDNAIHTFAGVQLRLACAKLMQAQGHEEPAGRAKITPAFNLPSRYVLHTVGPIVADAPTADDCRLLSSCYRSCLELAEKSGLESVAFCCISTGEFHFPNSLAAEIAINTVKEYKSATGSDIKVIFNVFKDMDYKLYRELLG